MIPRSDVESILRDAAREFEVTIKASVPELATATHTSMAHLATLIGDPDVAVAVRAERNALRLAAGIVAVDKATAGELQFVGVLHALLGLAFRVTTGT